MPYKDPEKARAHAREYARRYRIEQPERYLASIQRRNSKRSKAVRRKWQLKERYNITPEQYADMLTAQQGRCAVVDCRTAVAGGRHGTWQVDHDHATGAVRGLLCWKCNLMLGYYETLKPRFSAFDEYIAAYRTSGLKAIK